MRFWQPPSSRVSSPPLVDDPEAFDTAANALVDDVKGLLGGRDPELQGAVLADLVALWIAGHRIGPSSPGPGADRAEGDEMRAELLALHCRHVGELVEMYLEGVDG